MYFDLIATWMLEDELDVIPHLRKIEAEGLAGSDSPRVDKKHYSRRPDLDKGGIVVVTLDTQFGAHDCRKF